MGGNPTLEEFGKKFPSFQFVVLHHQFATNSNRKSHWDLLLEQPNPENTELLTFEVSEPPQNWEKTTSAKQLPDHRPLYLTFEGPISGNRGTVSQVLNGAVQWVTFSKELLVLNLQFHWEREKQSPLVLAILSVTKVTTENELDWDLKLQVCS
jgi:hypothetical protein